MSHMKLKNYRLAIKHCISNWKSGNLKENLGLVLKTKEKLKNNQVIINCSKLSINLL
jgi:hypothetical protein